MKTTLPTKATLACAIYSDVGPGAPQSHPNDDGLSAKHFANLGLTPQWLKDNATSAAVKSAANFVDAAQNQKDLFIKSFNDPEVLHKVVPGMFHFARTDDYPSAKLPL